MMDIPHQIFSIESNNDSLNEIAETFIIGDIVMLLVVGVPPGVVPVIFHFVFPTFTNEIAVTSLYFATATGWAGLLWWWQHKIFIIKVIPWWGACAFFTVLGIILWALGYPENDLLK
ncbi:MAG TPA: hypothetical protein VHM26_13270 [Chitinophagaceae bacterium]|jgi:hypothetical protein|nr:hypothetical protein [Chitinophagaceae bacterium]